MGDVIERLVHDHPCAERGIHQEGSGANAVGALQFTEGMFQRLTPRQCLDGNMGQSQGCGIPLIQWAHIHSVAFD